MSTSNSDDDDKPFSSFQTTTSSFSSIQSITSTTTLTKSSFGIQTHHDHLTFSQRPRTRPQRPRPTGVEPPHHDRDRNSQSFQKPIAIVFEILAGLVILAIAVTVIRCLYNYNRAPKRDRIAEILSRHRLQQELEELERNPISLRRQSLQEPAPPYFPPPPAYIHQLPQPVTLAPERSADYTQLPTSTPPPSPPCPTSALPTLPIHPSAPTTDSDSETSTSSPPLIASSSESPQAVTPTLSPIASSSTPTAVVIQLLRQPSG